MPDTNEEVEFYVLEQTRIGGANYLLVTDKEEGDAEALILKEVCTDDENDVTYEAVMDEKELMAVADVFEELFEDLEIEV